MHWFMLLYIISFFSFSIETVETTSVWKFNQIWEHLWSSVVLLNYTITVPVSIIGKIHAISDHSPCMYCVTDNLEAFWEKRLCYRCSAAFKLLDEVWGLLFLSKIREILDILPNFQNLQESKMFAYLCILWLGLNIKAGKKREGMNERMSEGRNERANEGNSERANVWNCF